MSEDSKTSNNSVIETELGIIIVLLTLLLVKDSISEYYEETEEEENSKDKKNNKDNKDNKDNKNNKNNNSKVW